MNVELEVSGNSVEEAIQEALEELGVEREDVEVEILEEPSKGFLGLGGHAAKVKVRVRPEILTGKPVASAPGESAYQEIGIGAEPTAEDEALMDAAEKFIADLLARMDIPGEVEASLADGSIAVDIDGDDMGLLIGRGGETLAAIQTLLSAHLSRTAGRKVYGQVDIQGYRERKRESLEGLAERISERVASTKQSYAMRPMPASERRLIHMWVKEHPKVESKSEGMEPDRRVVIYPKDH